MLLENSGNWRVTLADSGLVRRPDESTEPNLFDQLLRELRARHYSERTQRAYVGWARRFIAFHEHRHPLQLGAEQVCAFLDRLLEQRVSKSSHQQALCAL